MSRESELMLELMKDMRDEQREHAKLSSAHREETVKWQTQSDARTGRIEEDLREHKEGVIQNRDAGVVRDGRLDTLEEPVKAKAYLRKKYMKIAGVVAITVSIAAGLGKIFGWY
jgi:hypothetical protein